MNIALHEIEPWLIEHQYARYNLGESGMVNQPLGALLADVGASVAELGAVSLGNSDTRGSLALREAIAALHPGATALPEIQFSDYSLNTLHWLVYLGNLAWTSNGTVSANVIVRLPVEPLHGGHPGRHERNHVGAPRGGRRRALGRRRHRRHRPRG